MQPQNRSDVRWEWIGDAWKVFSDQMANWILQCLAAAAIVLIINVPLFLFTGVLGVIGQTFKSADSGLDPAKLAPLLVMIPLIVLVTILIIIPLVVFLTCGFWHTALKQLRGEVTSVADLFAGGYCFWSVLGATFLQGLIGLIAQVIVSIPSAVIHSLQPLTTLIGYAVSFALSGLFFFTFPLIVDRRYGVIDAIKASIDATKHQWYMYALLVLVNGLIVIIGFVVCCIGGLFTFHFSFTTPTIAYRDVFGLRGLDNRNIDYTPPPPPSYGGYEPPPPSSWQ